MNGNMGVPQMDFVGSSLEDAVQQQKQLELCDDDRMDSVTIHNMIKMGVF